jgi:hypothetical protein
MKASFVAALLSGAVSSATAAVLHRIPDAASLPKINEVFANPPGSDNGFEFFELIGTPATPLTGYSLLVIEGGGASAGIVDQALSLTGSSLGSNGLFLWRDAAAALVPAPAPGTSLKVADFSPDIENGGQTYLLVQNFTGTVGTDLDTNNDGLLDLTPWVSVVDAIGYKEVAADLVYGASLGFTDFALLSFTPDAIFRTSNTSEWIGADVIGANPGPYPLDPAEIAKTSGAPVAIGDLFPSGDLTPGNVNPALVPEPHEYAAVAGLGLAGFAAWRRRARRA